MGVDTKMFTIAGPVIVYGTVASVFVWGYLLDLSDDIRKCLTISVKHFLKTVGSIKAY